MAMEPAWYCLRCGRKREHIAAAHLAEAPTVQTYCPRIRYRKVTAQGDRSFVEALFPSYLFARFDWEADYRFVVSRPGVTDVVRFGQGTVPVVSDELIEALRQLFDCETITAVPHAPKLGGQATLVDGPFQGLTGLVQEVLPARERIVILLTILGEDRPVEARMDQAISAGDPRYNTDLR